jgi:hypothetical protein
MGFFKKLLEFLRRLLELIFGSQRATRIVFEQEGMTVQEITLNVGDTKNLDVLYLKDDDSPGAIVGTPVVAQDSPGVEVVADAAVSSLSVKGLVAGDTTVSVVAGTTAGDIKGLLMVHVLEVVPAPATKVVFVEKP